MSDDVDPAQIKEFLMRCAASVSSEGTRVRLRNSGRPGKFLSELQRQLFTDLGLDAGKGFQAVQQLTDGELLDLKKAMMVALDSAYMQCLEDRRPKEPKKGKMSRNTVLEFLEACNIKIELPEVKEKLRRKIEDSGELPQNVVDEVHAEVMELVGFEREYGRKCLGEFGQSQEFADDREVAMLYARWRGKASR